MEKRGLALFGINRISALLALLITASSCTVLTSCDSADTDTTPQDTTSAETTTAAVETEPEETKPQLELPDDINLDGRIINIAVQPSSGWVNQRDFKFSDEASGEPINDASKERIARTEELLNCKVNALEIKSLASAARADILAGGSAYDVIMPALTSVSSLGTEGLLMDLYSVEHIDTSKPWWSQQVTKHLSIAGKLYFTLGDLSIIDNDGTGAIGFNKKLIVDYNLDSPYDYIFDGTWTIDKMFTMAGAVVEDLNGDGVMDAKDRYGYVTDKQNLAGHITGGGINLTDKDENDLPVCNLNNERTIQIIDKFINFVYGGNAFATTDLFGGHGSCNTNFMNDQMLFRYTTMYRFTQMRNMETDFGFVTLPKLDESQDSYYSSYAHASPGTSIPITVNDAEAVGAAVETLSYYGREILLRAYYEINLQGKVARDDESAAVLDIIFDAATLDLGKIYNFGGIRDIWAVIANSNTNIFSSMYASIEQTMNTAIDKLVDTVSELD